MTEYHFEVDILTFLLEIDVCGSAHLSIIHIENPTRYHSVSKFYFLFIWSSTCFLMMGGVSPETCWASYKYEIKFWYTVASCWIFYISSQIYFYSKPWDLLILFLLLQSALQPLVGFDKLYDFVSQSSIFTLLSPVSHFHLLSIIFYLVKPSLSVLVFLLVLMNMVSIQLIF
jgi:hypothetical protein